MHHYNAGPSTPCTECGATWPHARSACDERAQRTNDAKPDEPGYENGYSPSLETLREEYRKRLYAPPKKIVRGESTPENKAFWDSMKKSAEGVKDWPDWKKAGINVNPRNFDAYKPNDEKSYALTCDGCGILSPIVHDEDEVIDAANDAGWMTEGTNEDDRDACPSCRDQPPNRHACPAYGKEPCVECPDNPETHTDLTRELLEILTGRDHGHLPSSLPRLLRERLCAETAPAPLAKRVGIERNTGVWTVVSEDGRIRAQCETEEDARRLGAMLTGSEGT